MRREDIWEIDCARIAPSWEPISRRSFMGGVGTALIGASLLGGLIGCGDDSEEGSSAAGSGGGGAPGAGKTISGGVLNGKALSKPDPPYPAVAKAARASGTVVVQITVDESGNVVEARAISGHPLLHAAAVAAARQAKFSPTLLSGKPVKVTGTITYNFELPAAQQ
jgi:protein TonB